MAALVAIGFTTARAAIGDYWTTLALIKLPLVGLGAYVVWRLRNTEAPLRDRRVLFWSRLAGRRA